MTYQNILYSLTGGIARITLNRPEKLNACNTAMHGELQDALARTRQGQARVLLLSGAGRGFCAGQDLDERDLSPARRRPISATPWRRSTTPWYWACGPCRCR